MNPQRIPGEWRNRFRSRGELGQLFPNGAFPAFEKTASKAVDNVVIVPEAIPLDPEAGLMALATGLSGNEQVPGLMGA